jgi:poly(A) polymerase
LRMMAEDGPLPAVLPEATRLDRLARLIQIEPTPADALRRLAALVDVDPAGMSAIAERLRLSNAQRDRLVGLAPPWPIDPAGDDRAQRFALYRLGPERYRDLALLAAAAGAVDAARLAAMLALAAAWRAPVLPVAARDVMALGIAPGPRVGRLLAELRSWWEEGDFAADRAACLGKLAEIAARAPP